MKPRKDADPDPDTEFNDIPAPRKTATDELIEHYKEEASRRDTIPYCYLYKYEDPKHGNEMQQVGKFAGEEIPDPHTVGLKFGAGRYGIKLYTAKGTAACSKQDWSMFKINTIYDEYKAKADAETHALELKRFACNQPTNTPTNNIAEPFLMVKEILSMILPIITAATRSASANSVTPGARQETPSEMINSYSMMQKLLKTNLFDTAETLKQYSQRYITAPAEEEVYQNEEPQEKEKHVVLKIIEMIEPFFSLIANKSPAATIAAQGLRSAPQFIEILSDPSLCRLIVSHFDRTKGRAAADIALKNIGIDRQKLFAQQPAQHNPQQPDDKNHPQIKLHQTSANAPKTA
jgi:hypothetical protein